MSSTFREPGYRESPEERLTRQLAEFGQRFAVVVREYGIEVSTNGRRPRQIESQRVAYLCTDQLIRTLARGDIGQDAACEFYRWAQSRGVHCLKPVCHHNESSILPSNYRRVLTHLCFDRFLAVADSVLAPQRVPLTRRHPVTRIRKPKPKHRY
jgi:hypothetical protein